MQERLLENYKPSVTSISVKQPDLCIAWSVWDSASCIVGFFSFNFSCWKESGQTEICKFQWASASTVQQQNYLLASLSYSRKRIIVLLTSKTGRSIRAFPEKWVLKPLAKFPIAWVASTETAKLTSVMSCSTKNHHKNPKKQILNTVTLNTQA